MLSCQQLLLRAYQLLLSAQVIILSFQKGPAQYSADYKEYEDHGQLQRSGVALTRLALTLIAGAKTRGPYFNRF